MTEGQPTTSSVSSDDTHNLRKRAAHQIPKVEKPEKSDKAVEKKEEEYTSKNDLTTIFTTRKRKAVTPPEPKQEEKTHRAVKRRKTGPVVEFVESLWRDWQQIFFIGTEWELYDDIFKTRWNFNHLEKMLAVGELKDKNVILFGATEPQTINGEMVVIPVIVAIVGDISLPRKFGIKSVQKAEEEIISMDTLRLTWVPAEFRSYKPETEDEAATLKEVKKRHHPIHRTVYRLHCTLRKNQIKSLPEEEALKYHYCLPYIIRPHEYLKGSQDAPTEVSGIITIEGRGVSYEFDWSMDDIEDRSEEILKDYELDVEKHKATLMDKIKQEVKEAKDKIKADKEKRKQEVEAIPEKERKAMDEMQFYKFYPQNQEPNLNKLRLMSSFINRYYGHANKVFPHIDKTEQHYFE